MTVFAKAIAAGSDDARQNVTTMDLTNAFTVSIINATDYAGFRFTNVTIPQGSTINSATLNTYLSSSSFDDIDARIYCQDIDDAGTFTSAASDISNRTPTTAYTAWQVTNMGVGWETSPDFAAAVQEVIERPGWASGNDLAVILDNQTAVDCRFRSYEYSVNAWGDNRDAVTITIDYTVAAAGGAMSKTARVRLSTKVGGLLT